MKNIKREELREIKGGAWKCKDKSCGYKTKLWALIFCHWGWTGHKYRWTW